MKKITLLAISLIAISFASCKKTHTCVCTQAGITTLTQPLPAQTSSAAKTTCSSYDNAITGTCTIQ